jgi:selenocysteine-specific elongation factor
VRSIVIGTAGHIDHGKSALVRALTGTDPDRLKEERERGITIDLGFAHAHIGDLNVAFVDVPGHERFVKNMLAGVGGIDGVLLVIAADESVMPQTREHFAICRLLRIPSGVIALTKADLVDADTIEVVAAEVRELVAGSPLEGAAIVPVSSRTGDGLDALRQALVAVADTVRPRDDAGAPRMPIDRVFSMRGFGTVVTGTLVAGVLRVDETVVLLPRTRRVKIRGLQVHGTAQPSAAAGRRVAVNLAGIDTTEIGRGDTLTREGSFDQTRRIDARVELLADAAPLRHGARVRFHQGTSELLGRVALAGGREIAPGGRDFVRIRLEAPAVLTRGDRFILRAYSPVITIGGGRVLDPLPARTPIRTAAAASRLTRLEGDTIEAARVFLEEHGRAGLPRDALARRLGASPDQVNALSSEMQRAGHIVLVDDALVNADAVQKIERSLLDAVAAHHKADPLSEGLPREEGRERFFSRAHPGLFDSVIQRLSSAGRLEARDRLRIPGQGQSLTAAEAAARDALERVYREAALAPPDLAGASAATRIPASLAERVSKLLVTQKRLVRVETLLFHADALARLKQEVKALKETGPAARVDVAGFKERYGISRKYAIPLLEWLDRERVTRRVGDTRVLL